MKMWSTFSEFYILSKLRFIKEEDEELILWQNREENRTKYIAKISSIDEDHLILKLHSNYKNADFAILQSLQLFIHYAKGDALFKKEAFKHEGLVITMKTPSEIMMKEQRSIERFVYKYQDYKSLQLTIDERYTKKKVALTSSCILVDLSIKGASIVVSAQESQLFFPGLEVNILSITDQKIQGECKASVKYVRSYDSRNEDNTELMRIGLEFTNSLESVVFKSIGMIVDKKQKIVKGLEIDSFNGLNPEEQERVLQSIAEKKPHLANNIRSRIEDIDRLRYLTPSMKQQFLMEVNLDLLAAAFRIASKELIYELFNGVTETMREEFLFKLREPKAGSAINHAQDEIYKFIKQQEKSGVISLDPSSFDVLV